MAVEPYWDWVVGNRLAAEYVKKSEIPCIFPC